MYTIAALCICSCLCALRAADLHTHVQRGITCALKEDGTPTPGPEIGATHVILRAASVRVIKGVVEGPLHLYHSFVFYSSFCFSVSVTDR